MLATLPPLYSVFVAGAIGYLAAGGFFFSKRCSRRNQTIALIAASVVILAAPLLIPAENRGLRLIGTLWAITLGVKVFDLYVAPGAGPSRLMQWLIHLPSCLTVVWRKLPQEPRFSHPVELTRLIFGACGFIAGIAVMRQLWNMYWASQPFGLEHVSKVSVLFLTLTAGAIALASASRLAGLMARDAMNWPFLAATPAEFWPRYNRPAQQFFYEDIFKPLGGRRRPVRATLLTFFVSGLIHEYVFAIPIGAIQAYQMAFFMLHGTAVAVTLRARPRGLRRPLGMLLTLSFTLATSVVFFASFNEIVPFYSAGFPRWLRDWTIFRW